MRFKYINKLKGWYNSFLKVKVIIAIFLKQKLNMRNASVFSGAKKMSVQYQYTKRFSITNLMYGVRTNIYFFPLCNIPAKRVGLIDMIVCNIGMICYN